MRVPAGAPVPFWLGMKNRFPALTKFSKPSLGTVGVACTILITGFAIYAVGVYPKIHNDYYKKAQAEERAQLKWNKEELAQGQRVWSDPFGKK
ncbi:unnamed protein product [Auanema sp. JU1783]|nr:unnamed protein product [Auanema sp. JU1783]